MSATVARTVLRPSRILMQRHAVRNASTTSEAASNMATKAKETMSQVTSKASEGLTKVTSSASESASSAASGTASQGRIGGMISTVQSMVPPAVYYSRVGLELGKLVFQGQKMSPPSISQFQTYLQPITNVIRNPSSFSAQSSNLVAEPQKMLSQARNFNGQQMLTVGIVIAELIGFFTVGEMIGKLKIVGYRSSEPAHDDHH